MAAAQKTGIDAVEFARKVVGLGAGEILLTSMDRDGTKAGYDIALTRAVADAVRVPVIACGGVGNARSPGRRHSRRPRDGGACRLDLPLRNLLDCGSQGAHGKSRLGRCGSTPPPDRLPRLLMTAFSLSDLEKIIADARALRRSRLVDGEAVCRRHGKGREEARRGSGRDGDRRRFAGTKRPSFRKVPILSIIGWSCWRSPAFRCPR